MSLLDPSVSVVMTHYRNERTLAASIRSFVSQQGARAKEIIVVDDGDTQTAQDIVRATSWPLPVKVLHTRRAGQSAATNAGILRATADVVFLTCADIIAEQGVLAAHLQEHAQHTELGVMGHIAYAPWIPMTPIMRFLQMPQVQFDFSGIQDINDVSGKRLYAPHFSIRKAALERVGMFDEQFPYGYQDCDLGLRLAVMGTRFVYRKEASVWHDHPNTVRGYAHRQHQVNTHWARAAKRYPKMAKLHVIAALLDQLVPKLPTLPSVVRLAERANAVGSASKAQGALTDAKLFALFDHLGSLAMVRGIVSNLSALNEVIFVEDRPWYRAYAQRAQPSAGGPL
jgi:GT2 family glycosyltransferase